MPDIPAEAAIRADERARIAAHLRAIPDDDQGMRTGVRRFIDRHERLWEGTSIVAVLLAAADEVASTGAGSPAACPSIAPESTESAQDPSAAPVYPPAPAKPAESLTALRGRMAEALAATCKLHEVTGECPACERRLAAVLSVRDDALARALRIADYHADLHRSAVERADRMAEMVIEKDREATQWADWLHQAEAAIARVRGLHSEIPYKPGFCYCANPYPCPTVRALDGAGAVPGEHTAPATTTEGDHR